MEPSQKSAYKRPDWDDYFIEVMEAIAKRGTCDRGRSGCVIAVDNQLVAAGYVGSPIGEGHCDDVGHLFQKRFDANGNYSLHCVRTIHAEQNAICQAAKRGISVEGGTLYCKMTPCPVCAKLIINCGIKRVVCQKRYHDGAEAERLFLRAGIAFEHKSEEKEEYAGQGNKEKEREEKTEWQPAPLDDKRVEPITDTKKLKIKKLDDNAVVPEFAHEGDAGLDLFAVSGLEIAPGERAAIPTGIAVEIPVGYVGLIWDRGGVSFKKGLKSLAGVVDSGFRGEVQVFLANISNETVAVVPGDKVAQMLIQPFERPEIELANDLSETERGDKMLGSSDKKKKTEENSDFVKVEEIIAQKEMELKEEDGAKKGRW